MTSEGGLFHAAEISTCVIWGLDNGGMAGHGHGNERERGGMMHRNQVCLGNGGSERPGDLVVDIAMVVSKSTKNQCQSS